MGIFSSIGAVFSGSSGTMFMFIVLAVSDHLWGENVFSCPCGDYRLVYTLAFLVVPPVVIILLDTSWRLLFDTCQMSCDEWDRSRRQHGAGCFSSSCCCCCFSAGNSKTCETLVRLFIRPTIIALLWLIFSTMEPKFSKCMFKRVPCDCTEKEKAEHWCSEDVKRKMAFMRVLMASLCLALICLVVLGALLFLLCKVCLRCHRRGSLCLGWCSFCRRGKYQLIEDEENSERIRELCRCLYTFGVEPKTVIRLQEESLMCERRLAIMSDTALQAVGRSVSLGQLEILREHRRNLRLARWMLNQQYSQDNIKAIVENENLLGSAILETIRESLHTTDAVEEGVHKQLREVLLQKGLSTLLPPSAPSGHLKPTAPDEEQLELYLPRAAGLRA
ncbi:uncharacterized protein LOC143281860 [Babylonia areolata]|uniref:uncharacterized protein LOC143281860 n=1 Tax=Babylonia areolata TaxID=304850 RepID=UPI003FD4EF79